LDQVIQAGAQAGEHFERAKKQRESGGVSSEGAAKLAVFLASERSAGLTGRLFSAAWDNWEAIDADKISRSSLYQMRRIDGIRFLEPTKSRADEHVRGSHGVDP